MRSGGLVFTFPTRCTEKTTTYIHRCTSILRALKKQCKGTLWTMPINYANLIANNLKYHLKACIIKQPARVEKKSRFGEMSRGRISSIIEISEKTFKFRTIDATTLRTMNYMIFNALYGKLNSHELLLVMCLANVQSY